MEPTTTILATFLVALIREAYRNYRQIKEKKLAPKKVQPAKDVEVPPVLQAMVAAYSKSIETLQSEKQLLTQDVIDLRLKLRDAEVEIARLEEDHDD